MGNLAFALGLPALGLLVGGAAAALEPRVYQDQAILDVGLRFLKSPIEPAYEARERMADALVRADAFGPEVELDVFIRREEKSSVPTRSLDLAVRAASATVAKAVLDQGLARILAAHAEDHAEAVGAARRQVERLDALAARVAASKALAPWDRARQEALDAALAHVDRLRWGSEEVLARLLEAPTEVRARPSAPTPLPRRGPAWILGGLITGVVLGLSLALVRGEPG
jgi:hypothetical protein